MKRRTTSILTLLLTFLLSMTVFFGCSGPKTKVSAFDNNVAFTAQGVEGSPTMVEFMQQLDEDGELEVRVENGYIVEINGKANSDDGMWVLYSTCGSEGVDNNGKSLDVKGNYYYPTNVSEDQLVVNESQYYIWHFKTAE